MFKYNYYRATSVTDVCEKLEAFAGKAKIIAGGTDLLVQMKEKDEKLKALDWLIDISALTEELRYIREEGENIRVGVLSTHTDIEQSELIERYVPFLGVASSTVGSPQIRNLGTIGGSICNASPAADPLTPMIAAGTVVVIQGMAGCREVTLEAFYHGKGATDLQEDEFVIAFIIHKLPQHGKSQFVKLGRRKALAISRLNVAVALELDEDNRITTASIAPGCIFVKPERVTRAEEVLIGKEPSKILFAEVAKVVSEVMIEKTGIRWSTEYKQPAVEGVVEEALAKSVGMEA